MCKYFNDSLEKYLGSPKHQAVINNASYQCDLEGQNKIY